MMLSPFSVEKKRILSAQTRTRCREAEDEEGLKRVGLFGSRESIFTYHTYSNLATAHPM